MIINGKLIKCRRERKEFNGRQGEEKLFITLAEVELTPEQEQTLKDAFRDSGKNFTPSWVQNFEGYVNVSTKYELPVKDYDGVESDSIEDAIADDLLWIGADCKLSVNVKEGAVYPKAIILLNEGKPFNPFEEFED